MSYNEADAVRLVRPKGKRCRHYIVIVFLAEVSADFMNNSGKIGLFTDQGHSSGKEVAHEDVVNYLE
jgi:hypothetical protein